MRTTRGGKGRREGERDEGEERGGEMVERMGDGGSGEEERDRRGIGD